MTKSTLKDCIQNLYQKYVEKAYFNNRKWDLPFRTFSALVQDRCYYCGLPSENSQKITYNESIFRLNQIDRVDPNSDYTKANVLASCLFCNHAKANLNQEAFLKMVSQIYFHQNSLGMVGLPSPHQMRDVIDPLNARLSKKDNLAKRSYYHEDK